jgi:hypothetical protein
VELNSQGLCGINETKARKSKVKSDPEADRALATEKKIAEINRQQRAIQA